MKEVRKSFFRFVLPAAIVVTILVAAAPANAQAILKVSDTVNLKFGILMQGWADWQQTQAAGETNGYAQNLFLRRMRILMAGQVAKDVTFFLETDDPNLGKAPKNLYNVADTATSPGFIIQDAFMQWKIANEFMIQGGLILIPLCRNCNTSAASLLTLDYGSFSFLESATTQSVVGRDTGFQAVGYLLSDRLEYRAGAYQGFRTANSHNSFRFTGRLQYDFLDVEKGQFYPGTYLGKKKVLAIGAGYDTQGDYKAYAFDGFLDLPVGKGNGLTVEADFVHYDGGTFFTTMYNQDTEMVRAGFYFGGVKLMPFLQYENESFKDDIRKVLNSRNFQAGLAYYPYGYNFNIKLAYTLRERPNDPVTANTNEFTLQMQLFYF